MYRKSILSIISIVLVLSAIGSVTFSSGCVGGGNRGSSSTWLSLVPSNAIIAGVFNMNVMKNGETNSLMREMNFYSKYVNYTKDLKKYTGINMSQAKRIIVVIEGSLASLESQSPPIALYIEVPVNTTVFAKKIVQDARKGMIPNVTMNLTYDGVRMYCHKDFAIAFTSSYVIYGSKVIVQQMLDLKTNKNGASWARKYQDINRRLGGGSLMIVGDLRYVFSNLNSKETYSQNATMNKLIRSFISQATYLTYGGLSVKVDKGYSINVLMKADDHSHAEHLVKIINAVITIENTTLNPNTLTSTMARRRMREAKRILSEVKVSSSMDYVTVTLHLSENQVKNLVRDIWSFNTNGTSTVVSTRRVKVSSTCPGGCS